MASTTGGFIVVSATPAAARPAATATAASATELY